MRTLSVISVLMALAIGCGTTTQIVDNTYTIPGEDIDTTIILDGGGYSDDGLYIDEDLNSYYSADYLAEIRALEERCRGEIELVTAAGSKLQVQFSVQAGEKQILRDSLGNVVRGYTKLLKQWKLREQEQPRTITVRDTTRIAQSPPQTSIWERIGMTVFLIAVGFAAGVIFSKI
jgi:hypothetical protein